jgi:hypothetical protein
MLRKMEEHLSAMLAKVKADPELQGSSELIHVTGDWLRALEQKFGLSKGRSQKSANRKRSEAQKGIPKAQNERDVRRCMEIG